MSEKLQPDDFPYALVDRVACIKCKKCFGKFFKEDQEGIAAVKEQPETDEEIAEVKKLRDICPTNAIKIEFE